MTTPAIEERKIRMKLAISILNSRDRIGYDDAVALLSFNLGLSKRKSIEYIEMIAIVRGVNLVTENGSKFIEKVSSNVQAD